MRYTLENETLRAEFESKGAELKSVVNKKTNVEYMWQGDPTYWNRTSPVLFPFVGGVVNDEYTFEGTRYHMGQHGFARDNEFEVASHDSNSIFFKLIDNEETYKNYPFHFELQVGYILNGKSLEFVWKVKNPGQDRADGNLYFSIGGHPAFNCPIALQPGNDDTKEAVGNSKTGYILQFDNLSQLHHHGNLNGTATREDIVLQLDNGKVTISDDFFNRSTYIVENNQAHKISLSTPEGVAYITVEFEAPLFGIWSPIGKNAPFVCIEPWYGRTDYDDYCGDLTHREYGNVLAPQNEFEKKYIVTYFEG